MSVTHTYGTVFLFIKRRHMCTGIQNARGRGSVEGKEDILAKPDELRSRRLPNIWGFLNVSWRLTDLWPMFDKK